MFIYNVKIKMSTNLQDIFKNFFYFNKFHTSLIKIADLSARQNAPKSKPCRYLTTVAAFLMI